MSATSDADDMIEVSKSKLENVLQDAQVITPIQSPSLFVSFFVSHFCFLLSRIRLTSACQLEIERAKSSEIDA
eukprot:755385-Hanusia_phi.AAC.1